MGLKTPRRKPKELVDLIREIKVSHGSQAKLLQSMIKVDPGLAGLPVNEIKKWIDGSSRPNYQQASALALLMQPHSDRFWSAYGGSTKAPSKPRRSRSVKQTEEDRSTSVYGVAWVGSRTENLELMCAFYESVLGLHLIHRCEHDHAIFRTDNGDYVALYGPDTARYELFTTGPVIGFRVANIVATRSEMEQRGVKFLGPIHSRENGRWKYCHYVAPDGNIYEIVEEKPWPDMN